MADHPAKAFSQKKDSSIAVGYGMLKNGNLDGFCSAGNTGAMLVGASYTVNMIPGVLKTGTRHRIYPVSMTAILLSSM